MARPEGAQALRAIQEALDEGRSLPVVNYIPLPMIGEGLGEWFEAPSYEEGVGDDGSTEGLPSDRFPKGNFASIGKTSPFKKIKNMSLNSHISDLIRYICSHIIIV